MLEHITIIKTTNTHFTRLEYLIDVLEDSSDTAPVYITYRLIGPTTPYVVYLMGKYRYSKSNVDRPNAIANIARKEYVKAAIQKEYFGKLLKGIEINSNKAAKEMKIPTMRLTNLPKYRILPVR
ncbi:hypothetical protein [Candidatus Magnetominusculus dajiuhuensis]|uniref:hypothetical protein n=1 Tax=Candidatus Magnetominusculus dajiuhuensis TaxID=3137712 RepID=UPI003B43A6C4